jgi:hypothetical protein
MPGGLIQIVAYGSQDLFLTGIPQITFFKIVYKKHTNFSMESIVVPLDGNNNFNQKTSTIIPKSGDLISKVYLQVDIPSVSVYNPNKYIDSSLNNSLISLLSQYNATLVKYNNFFKYNFIVLNGLQLEIKTIGSSWISVNNLMTQYKKDYQQTINNIGVTLTDCITKFYVVFPQSSSSKYVGSDNNTKQLIVDIQKFIYNMKTFYQSEEKKLFDNIYNVKQGLKNINSLNDYFAWTEKLGFNLINKCSVLLGGNEMASFDSYFLDIYSLLNRNFKQTSLLNEMIGNTYDLTNYTDESKPNKTLYIPLPFWFTLHNGSALPLISMIYHDIEFFIKYNSLENCCFYNGDINLNGIINLGSCSLLVDYIFLDTDERKKFAQFNHEYLIQNNQTIISNDTNILQNSLQINFVHPIKELYWILQETNILNEYRLYNHYYPINIFKITRINQTRLDELNNNSKSTYNLITINFQQTNNDTNIFPINTIINLRYTKYYDGKYNIFYSTNDYIIIKTPFIEYTNYNNNFYGIIFNEPTNNYTNPIDLENITFNGSDRTPYTDSIYYNYVIPYQYYKCSVNDGINVYSFSLHPDKYQPSGSCNFSLIKNSVINFKLNQKYYDYITNNNLLYNLRVYAINFNVLRIHNGITNLIFS